MASLSRFISFQLPAIFWALLIFISSSIPSQDLPKIGILRFDKIIHFLIYLILAYLCNRAVRNQNRYPALRKHHLAFTVLCTLLYGATDELHQLFVPGRECSLLDLTADLVGAIVLTGVLWLRTRNGVHREPGDVV